MASKAWHCLTPKLRALSKAIKKNITAGVKDLQRPEDRDKLHQARKAWESA